MRAINCWWCISMPKPRNHLIDHSIGPKSNKIHVAPQISLYLRHCAFYWPNKCFSIFRTVFVVILLLFLHYHNFVWAHACKTNFHWSWIFCWINCRTGEWGEKEHQKESMEFPSGIDDFFVFVHSLIFVLSSFLPLIFPWRVCVGMRACETYMWG